jgi:hypothetical protein
MKEKLKQLNIDRLLDLDEAIEMSAAARVMAEEYAIFALPIPDWLERASATLRDEIAKRIRAGKLARLKQLETRLETYKTPNEKKKEDLAELAKLQNDLGLAAVGRKAKV